MSQAQIRIHARSCFLCKYEKHDLSSNKCVGCLTRGTGFTFKDSKQRELDGIMQDSKGCYVLREVKYADESKGGKDSGSGVDLERVSKSSRIVDDGEGLSDSAE